MAKEKFAMKNATVALQHVVNKGQLVASVAPGAVYETEDKDLAVKLEESGLFVLDEKVAEVQEKQPAKNAK